MKRNSLLFSILGAFYAGVLLTCTAFAQTPEEQAKSILQLFEQGQRDTAYSMLEPLKKSARFVPAVIYTRAQMTPDDRALALYKELIALEPAGPWADRAAHQLVVRYTDKRDSAAAYTWAAVLKANHPGSSLVASAEAILAGMKAWDTPADDLAELPPAKGKPVVNKDIPLEKKPDVKKADEKKPDEKKPEAKKGEPKKADAKKPDPKKPDAKKADEKKPDEKKEGTASAPTETYSASGMKGYALQVGIFPTKDKADTRAAELKKKNLRSVPLPKMVGGKKQYALVVGPYTSLEEANKRKQTVGGICDCKTFIVRVQ